MIRQDVGPVDYTGTIEASAYVLPSLDGPPPPPPPPPSPSPSPSPYMDTFDYNDPDALIHARQGNPYSDPYINFDGTAGGIIERASNPELDTTQESDLRDSVLFGTDDPLDVVADAVRQALGGAGGSGTMPQALPQTQFVPVSSGGNSSGALIAVLVVGAAGFGLWWYFKKRKGGGGGD